MNASRAMLAGWAAAAAIPPVMVVGFDQPIWLALGVAGGVFGAVWGGLSAMSGRRPRRVAGAEAQTREGTAHGLLEEGQAALGRLRQTGGAIRDELMRDDIRRLIQQAERVLRDVRDQPAKVMAVRRLLAFYLPNAASVAEGWRALENKHTPAPEIELQARETVAALNDAFGRFADEAQAPQLQTLDLDLKVLRDALKADLER